VNASTVLIAIAMTIPMPCPAAAGERQAKGHEAHEPTNMSFVAPAVTIVRAAPDPAAREIKTLQPLDVVMVYDAVPGWVHVDLLSKDEPAATGWVKAVPDDIVPDGWLTLRVKAMTLRKYQWAARTKLDIMRQRARVGFSKNQVTLALGDPTTIRTTETKAGARAAWVYRDQVITFAGDSVVEIDRVSAPQ